MAKNSTLFSNVSFISRNGEGFSAAQAREGFAEEALSAPCDAIIANILNFSKALKVEKSRGGKTIEFMLN
jgi:hypothetical protein